ncbi:MAG TPA: radical SAM protein [Alphaproteobacteria bacterium]|nr:radical SAM protein [Alphaproteobacteria bacterium]
MFYTLADSVYLVDGAVNSCIYDLAKGKLYSISRDGAILLKSGNAKTALEKDFFEKLLSVELIVKRTYSKTDILCLKREPVISFAWVEITNKCNLECIHCYENSSPHRNSVMSNQQFERCVNELKALGVKSIQVIGGEPLLLGKELLIPSLVIAANSFEKVEIFTNGTLIDKEWVSIFKKLGIHVAVSVYSYASDEHDKVTGIQGSHQRTCHSLELLDKFQVRYRVASLRFKNVKLGKKTNQCFTLFNRKRSIVLAGRASLSLYNKSMLLAKMLTLKCFSKSISFDSVSKMVSGHNCFSTRLYIDSNMDVYPCVMERQFKHGNLLDNNLSDILKTEIFDLTKDKIESCKVCEFRYACMDCRPDRFSGNLYAKPWYCAYVPEEGKWLSKSDFFKILEGLQCA